jgi:cytochrome c oxidase subunit II
MKIRLTAGTGVFVASMLAATTMASAPRPVQKIDVSASRFSFEPHEITVKKGEPVILSVHSTDVTHGLVIEELGVRTEVKKGEAEDVNMTPETAGTFEGRCAHFCGKGHASMTLTVHVVE